jgi:hypothetical protein
MQGSQPGCLIARPDTNLVAGLDDLLFRRHGPHSFREREDSTELSD